MNSRYQDVGFGITRIDVEYLRRGFAAAWLIQEGGKALFVETGPLPAVGLLLDALTHQGLSPEAVEGVVVTHVHLDHAGGAGELLRFLPNARLMVHPRGVEHLIDPSRLIEGAKMVYGESRFLATLGGAVPVDPARIHAPVDGEVYTLQGRSLTFLDTPGHSLNHLCLFDAKSRGVFTGDAFGLSYRAFDGGVRPLLLPATTPTQFDVAQSKATLRRLAALQPARLYLTHFGPISFLPELVDDLEIQLDLYQQLGLSVVGECSQAEWIDGLVAITKARMLALGIPELSVEQMGLLAMDLELNAQGLAVWSKRQQRQLAR